MTVRIPPGEVEHHPHSFVDSSGRLLWWRGRLYRAIPPEGESFLARLLDEGVLRELAGQGLLIETERADVELDGYSLVLRHPTVPFVSYPNEWCPPMFKTAVLALLDLASELAERGLALKDAHPWNLVYHGCRPVWVDVGSIVPDAAPGWSPAGEFVRFCLNPLLLMAGGASRVARHLLPDYEGIGPSELGLVASGPLRRRAAAGLAARVSRDLPRGTGARAGFFRDLRARIADIAVPGEHAATTPGRPSDAAVRSLIEDLQPVSLLAVESPSSARIASRDGVPVVALDRDESEVSALYGAARAEELELLPLVMDFTLPTPSRGIAEHAQIAATRRLRCDLVVALGVVERIRADYGLAQGKILEGLAAFAGRWVAVDGPVGETAGFVPIRRDGGLTVLERRA